jgi:predicted nuclease with TOPRIM domain
MKYEGVITKSVTAVQRLKELYSKDQIDEKDISAIKTNASQLQKDRKELKEGYKKMRVLISFLKIANEFLPPGADTFTDLSFTVFEEAGKSIDKLGTHAEEIEKNLGVFDSFNKNISNYERRRNYWLNQY